MTIVQAIILGIIQGIGEFLPISSSGHLVLAPWLFEWTDPGLAFDVALHFGTLMAVLLFFFKDWLSIFKSGFTGKSEGAYSPKLLWLLVLATIPAAVIGYLLEDLAESKLRNPLLIAGTLSSVGFLLFYADRKAKGDKNVQSAGLRDVVLVGAAQVFAIIPGVSRAGSTITAALGLGYDRVSAAKLSFLLSTPIILGATLLQADDFLAGGVGLVETVGVLTAAVSGYLSIAALLKFIEKVSYKIFFIYRLVLAVLIVVLWLVR